ncbi:MAG: acetyl-CoA carboxylase biotin carboxylase subunit [Rhodobacteraceae bacterium]|nr:acetyl-CoA carboxylase biotin carboxylase subunit [Paracoccaceae bacterium]
MAEFDTLLVANRGEIALRIMRTARDVGLRVVAVYSEADTDAPHVRFADDAVCLGPAAAADSYLRGDRIIAAAQATGAGAIHPGYGFLSENAGFARAVAEAGLVFVGPSPEAIDLMGDKARAKRRMIAAGVPCVPGYEEQDQSPDRFVDAAAQIGFPVMVKAAAGGGGKGMRLVQEAAELPNALTLARAEAEASFGAGDLILEKAVIQPRHVEIQVFGDHHGTIIHLGERDCSVQRRHQKVIEEAPSPAVDADLRARMGQAAVEAAAAVDYVGAGTVEFLLDTDGKFYFLEMNTRLQVEHPVTEMVTGLDLVALQLRVAMGEPLGLSQDDVTLSGHAIEVRLYAEDPAAGFLPSGGPVHLWHPSGQARVDAGVGAEVSPHYDPMLAKIITHGPTRGQALARLRKALRSTALFGPQTNRDFLIDALGRDAFTDGSATTGFIEQVYGDRFDPGAPTTADLAVAAVLHRALAEQAARAKAPGIAPELLGWSSATPLDSVVVHEEQTIRIRPQGDGYDVVLDEAHHHVTLRRFDPPCADLTVDGTGMNVVFTAPEVRELHVALPDRTFVLHDSGGLPHAMAAGAAGLVTAPMHGRLVELCVATGDTVAKGQKLAVLEAMKMQHELCAEVAGTVSETLAQADAQLAAGAAILMIEAGEG